MQTDITGQANVANIEEGSSCCGTGVLLKIYANVEGMYRTNNEAVGLNSFVIKCGG